MASARVRKEELLCKSPGLAALLMFADNEVDLVLVFSIENCGMELTRVHCIGLAH